MLLCMRTTIDLDDQLFRQLKQDAARRGTTLREVVHDYIRAGRIRKENAKKYKFRWKTERGQIQPGVRLDDRDSLFDLMDGR